MCFSGIVLERLFIKLVVFDDDMKITVPEFVKNVLAKGLISTDHTFGNASYNSEKNLTDHLTVITELRLKEMNFLRNLKTIARANGEPRQINECKNYLNNYYHDF